MTNTVYVRNNSEHPIALTPKVGGPRIRLECGWNEVPSGYIERVTGGFKKVGSGRNAKMVPRGGSADLYFTEVIKIGKRNLPRLQLGTPVEGDHVHMVQERPGLRSHYRTRQTEERTKREFEQERAIAGLEARIEMLTQRLEQSNVSAPGGSEFDPTGLDLDDIKSQLDGLDLATVRHALGIEVAGENRTPVVKALRARARKLSKD